MLYSCLANYIEHFEVMNMEARRRFVGSGYAWVDVDVRGSGASEGHRKYGPWHQDELDDAREILDWIVAQNWSSGVIGAFGTSLEGVCAEMLLAHLHPAVKAVSPRFAPFDIYSDIAFPGGIPTSWFMNMWQLLNNHFDTNTIEIFLGVGVGVFIDGITPALNDDPQGDELQKIVKLRPRGWQPVELSQNVTFKDDSVMVGNRSLSVKNIGPSALKQKIEESRAAIYAYSGWSVIFSHIARMSNVTRHIRNDCVFCIRFHG
jgi:putative CocE/NonD family hydrolase